jgi:hypothetical protein
MNDQPKEPLPDHFKGKEALEHVIEAREAGIRTGAEIHGTEISGPLSAFADALRETAIFLTFVLILLHFLQVEPTLYLIGSLSFGWLFWKAGRSAWLGWARLERLHRIVQEERWEIEHHRGQERDELKELYRARGFEGKLLDDVIDVLMSDGDRLLRVMVEEELGLTLENQEHPLKQAIGAAIGAFLSALLMILSLWLLPTPAWIFTAFLILAFSGYLFAHYSGNNRIPAIMWHLGIGALAAGSLFFCLNS